MLVTDCDKAVHLFYNDLHGSKMKRFTLEDVIQQQSEGAGFDSKEVEEVLDHRLDTDTGQLKEEEDVLSLWYESRYLSGLVPGKRRSTGFRICWCCI